VNILSGDIQFPFSSQTDWNFMKMICYSTKRDVDHLWVVLSIRSFYFHFTASCYCCHTHRFI